MSALWSGHAGAAAGCFCQSGVCFGAGMLVLLQGAAARCWCKVMLEGAVRVVCALPSGHAGAAAITFMP